MDLRIFTEPQQGASYDDQLAIAQRAERLGFSAFFRSDHFLRMGDGDPLPGPTDAWTTLAGLARETSTIRLGTLVTSATFRHPGILAVQVAQVDAMSGGRVELGLGAGWFAEEHDAYGVPFPAKRFGLLEEQLEIITGLWGTPVGEKYSFDGKHYQLTDSPALPKPVQQPVPVIVGGGGPRRTPRLAARFAAEYNQSFPEKSDVVPADEPGAGGVRGGRPQPRRPGLLGGASSPAWARTRPSSPAAPTAIGREPAELREHGLAGTPAEMVDGLGRARRAGHHPGVPAVPGHPRPRAPRPHRRGGHGQALTTTVGRRPSPRHRHSSR